MKREEGGSPSEIGIDDARRCGSFDLSKLLRRQPPESPTTVPHHQWTESKKWSNTNSSTSGSMVTNLSQIFAEKPKSKNTAISPLWINFHYGVLTAVLLSKPREEAPTAF
jgi:hypothetical protein